MPPCMHESKTTDCNTGKASRRNLSWHLRMWRARTAQNQFSVSAQHRTSKVNSYSLFAEATLAKEAVFGLTLGSPSGCRAERRGLGSGTPLLRKELEMRRSRARDAVPQGGAQVDDAWSS